MKFSPLPALKRLSVLTCTAVCVTGCAVIGAKPPPVNARQVECPPPELLKLDPVTGKLVYPCPRAAPPATYVDPATGRETTSVGELGRFGQESDAFVTVCEGRVTLGAFSLANCERQRQAAEDKLRPRTLWERLTPWKED